MAAQNVGAGKMDRVDKVAGIGVTYAALLSGIPILIIYSIEPIVLRVWSSVARRLLLALPRSRRSIFEPPPHTARDRLRGQDGRRSRKMRGS